MVTEVAGEEPGVRVFVVQSEERLAYERAMREAAMGKTRQALEKLSLRVATGRLKKPQRIGEAAARILTMEAAIIVGALSKAFSATLSIQCIRRRKKRWEVCMSFRPKRRI
jgi:hypothetical protein